MVAAAGLVVTQIAISRLRVSVKQSGWALLAGAVVMVLGMGVLSHPGDFVQQLVAMAVFGIGMGMLLPSTLALLTVVAEAAGDQGRVGGWSGAAQGLGLVFGPLVGALTYRPGQAVPYRIAFLLLLMAALVAAFGVPKALRDR